MLCADGNSCFLLCNQLLFLLYKLILLFQQVNPAVQDEVACGEKQGCLLYTSWVILWFLLRGSTAGCPYVQYDDGYAGN